MHFLQALQRLAACAGDEHGLAGIGHVLDRFFQRQGDGYPEVMNLGYADRLRTEDSLAPYIVGDPEMDEIGKAGQTVPILEESIH